MNECNLAIMQYNIHAIQKLFSADQIVLFHTLTQSSLQLNSTMTF